MGYFFAALTAAVTISGNITAKLWADNRKPVFLAITLVFYIASSIAFPLALKYGKLSVLNAFSTIFIFSLTTLAGFFLFKERLTFLQSLGLGLAFASIIFLTIEGRA